MIGNFVNPITPALLVKVSEVKTIIPAKVVQTTGMEGLLCTKVSGPQSGPFFKKLHEFI